MLGDSDADEGSAIPKPLVQKLQWWLTARFAGPFVDTGSSLRHAKQGDSSSCGIYAINAIEHAVFKQPLCGPNAAAERARWFCLTSSSQFHDRAENGPTHLAILSQAEQERIEQGRAERRKADREMLEHSSLECNKAESQQSVRRKVIGKLEAVLVMGRRSDGERKRAGHEKAGKVQADSGRAELGGAEHELPEPDDAGPGNAGCERAERAKEEGEEARQGQADRTLNGQGGVAQEEVKHEGAWQGQAAGRQWAEHQRNDVGFAQVKQQRPQQEKAQSDRTKLGNTAMETSLEQVNTECMSFCYTCTVYNLSPVTSSTSCSQHTTAVLTYYVAHINPKWLGRQQVK